jgi:hypothetical protein
VAPTKEAPSIPRTTKPTSMDRSPSPQGGAFSSSRARKRARAVLLEAFATRERGSDPPTPSQDDAAFDSRRAPHESRALACPSKGASCPSPRPPDERDRSAPKSGARETKPETPARTRPAPPKTKSASASSAAQPTNSNGNRPYWAAQSAECVTLVSGTSSTVLAGDRRTTVQRGAWRGACSGDAPAIDLQLHAP